MRYIKETLQRMRAIDIQISALPLMDLSTQAFLVCLFQETLLKKSPRSSRFRKLKASNPCTRRNVSLS